jgi:hypothetical protein
MTHFLATRAASRQADRQERQEERRWQRSEAVRKEVRDREEAARLQALRDDRLRDLWGHVLKARWLMLDWMERWVTKSPASPIFEHVPGAESPASAAAQAYAVALLGLVAVRPAAAAYYEATAKLQLALQAGDGAKLKNLPAEWNQSFKALEDGIATLVDLGGCGTR